ncbi:MAG: NAD-dependent epimerase/dehydratase family protein [Clostridiales Family XIII bacterium]|jgi:UDP-glucose 4-epimerase|nr:NAD-dependent epimerase/dehydratase family protein [Clostridiales Family XIII bacterium]
MNVIMGQAGGADTPGRAAIGGANILITGGAGFIGSHLADRLLDEGAARVVVLDNLFLGKLENLTGALGRGAVFIRDDAEIEGTLAYAIAEHGIDVVFNCATKALNYSFINPLNAYLTNVRIMANLLELQRAGAFATLCHFSSSEVYGTAVYEPMDESHPMNPTTTYAAGKAAADIMLHSYVKQYGLDSFIMRPFNNYGPRQNFEGPLAGIIPATARRVMSGEPPEIHGTGGQSRDFIYVLDTVDAVMKLYGRLPAGEAVNISTNGQISVNELMALMARELGYTGETLRKEARTADVLCHNASNEKMKTFIDFTPTPFSDGLRETLAWYKAHI